MAILWLAGVTIASDKDTGSPAFLYLGTLCTFACCIVFSPVTLFDAENLGLEVTSVIVANLAIACLGLTPLTVGSLRGLFAWCKAAALVAFSLAVAIDACAIMFRARMNSDDQMLVRIVAQSQFKSLNTTLTIAALTPPALFIAFLLSVSCYGLFAGNRDDQGESTANSPQNRRERASKAFGSSLEGDPGRVASLQRALDSTNQELAAQRAANEALAAENSVTQDNTTLQSVTQALRTLKDQFASLVAQQRERDSVPEAIPVNASTDEYKLDEKP